LAGVKKNMLCRKKGNVEIGRHKQQKRSDRRSSSKKNDPRCGTRRIYIMRTALVAGTFGSGSYRAGWGKIKKGEQLQIKATV